MYPFAEIKKSQQATAPIFPWDASFTIDGINGFRYGDVVTFEVLPTRYRVNTVFSVIGINHDLAQDGQWKTEIKRCMPKANVICILTKNSHSGLKFKDFVNADIIITSHQFIMNFKFYPTLHYQTCTASNFNFDHRNASVKQYLSDKISKLGFPLVTELDQPIFEFFNFHRLILDEGHEIFGEMLGTAALGKYMSNWVSNIDSNYYWYVSGTPFVNYTGVKNCAKFINLKLEDTERDLIFDYSNTCLLYTSPSPRDRQKSRMPSSA